MAPSPLRGDAWRNSCGRQDCAQLKCHPARACAALRGRPATGSTMRAIAPVGARRAN